MAKPKKPADEDILPPEPGSADDDLSPTEKAARGSGARLRMPPLIDHGKARAGDWADAHLHDWRDRAVNMAQGVHAGSLHLLRRGLYHLTLWALVGATLVITGYGIWQARHMQVPKLDVFWFNSERAERAAPAATDRLNGPAPSADMPTEMLTEMPTDIAPDNPPETLSDAAAKITPPRDMPQTISDLNDLSAVNDALRREIENRQQAEIVLKQELAALKTRLSAAEIRQTDIDIDALHGRLAMAELLLRLQAGLPFDDIFAAGHLQNVLTRREAALLGLHADIGLPTRLDLLLQFETWRAAADRAPADGAANDGVMRQAARSGDHPYRRLMDWLSTVAGGLLQVKATPMALADDRLNAIHAALNTGDFDAATLHIGRLLRRFDGQADISMSRKMLPTALPMASIVVLQSLYDDARTAAELAPLVARLKQDYLSGARP